VSGVAADEHSPDARGAAGQDVAAPGVPDDGARADGETLAALITTFARRLSDTTLAAFTAGGLLAAAAVALVAPSWWRLLVPPAAMLAALGAWGIADRERAAVGGRRAVFATVRFTAMAIGIASALALAMAVLRVALGTWIS
jgi:hypothetical protein